MPNLDLAEGIVQVHDGKKSLSNLVLGFLSIIISLSTLALLYFDNAISLNRVNAYELYTLSLTSINKPVIPETGFGSGTGSDRYVNFSYLNADEDIVAHHVKLSTVSGAVYNTSPITGFDTIKVVFSGGGLILYTGNTQTPSTNSKVLTSNVLEPINDAQYFRLLASGSGNISIESIVISYSCQPLPVSDFQYNNLGTSYSVTGYTGSETSIVIPSTYNSKPVSTIAQQAFRHKTTITSVTIPDSVTTIGNQAFQGCTNLLSITIPDSVTVLGTYILADCSALTSVTLPSNIPAIPAYMVSSCTHLTSISIPVGVISIGQGSFQSCSALTSIHFEGTVAQWSAITLGLFWNLLAPAKSVTCTNGSVAIYQP